MLSNNQAKLIRSLQKKKQRDISGYYVIEGDKLVREYLKANEDIVLLAASLEWLSKLPEEYLDRADEVVELNNLELKKVSSLKTPNNSLAIVRIRSKEISPEDLRGKLSIALDSIQDPGNLGTIIRTAAWFGIRNIICSNNCVDLYNPKVIQSTMGGLLHTDLYYTDLKQFLENSTLTNIEIFAATLDGESIYKAEPPDKGLLLFGNESIGISDTLIPFVTKSIMIPRGSVPGPEMESLNVASSLAIICNEFIRGRKF